MPGEFTQRGLVFNSHSLADVLQQAADWCRENNWNGPETDLVLHRDPQAGDWDLTLFADFSFRTWAEVFPAKVAS